MSQCNVAGIMDCFLPVHEVDDHSWVTFLGAYCLLAGSAACVPSLTPFYDEVGVRMFSPGGRAARALPGLK
jgi:hypothetical protein